jgi:hypothetical protein
MGLFDRKEAAVESVILGALVGLLPGAIIDRALAEVGLPRHTAKIFGAILLAIVSSR